MFSSFCGKMKINNLKNTRAFPNFAHIIIEFAKLAIKKEKKLVDNNLFVILVTSRHVFVWLKKNQFIHEGWYLVGNIYRPFCLFHQFVLFCLVALDIQFYVCPYVVVVMKLSTSSCYLLNLILYWKLVESF